MTGIDFGPDHWVIVKEHVKDVIVKMAEASKTTHGFVWLTQKDGILIAVQTSFVRCVREVGSEAATATP